MSVKKKAEIVGRGAKALNAKTGFVAEESMNMPASAGPSHLAQTETNMFRVELIIEMLSVNSDQHRHESNKDTAERYVFIAARDLPTVVSRSAELCELVRESYGNPEAVDVSVNAITCLTTLETQAFVIM